MESLKKIESVVEKVLEKKEVTRENGQSKRNNTRAQSR